MKTLDFQCEHCGSQVAPLTNGSFRNHCPYCLYSKHLDNTLGDRTSHCGGLMKPIGIDYSGKKGYQIIQRCKKCGKISRNKMAVDTVQEDCLIEFMQSLI
ncbi:RNHCP domain-containing protein [Lederbergia sp. NSJ-179]|uniref:RNHCP domain-containing protein n=1 Tax=Lederbergia sp. NSJ-179 TaxID=2931402 RepID=UPI001FD48E83|nr:RNHCP domain-containing protein [Lederbergia sp. NSJ-179]MCJ7841455.1 RNHCP domain-containing protein [Lederbergia sp. NSJ-179]